MRFERPLHMPLQTGGTAFRSILFSFVLVPFFWAVLPFLLVIPFLVEARKRRACDVVLSQTGVRVDGGPHAGLAWSWTDPALAKTAIENTMEMFVQVGDKPPEYVRKLAIDGIVVAEVADAEEYASMSTLAEVLRDAGRPDAPRAPPKVDVERCASCGAPLVPADADAVTCPYCGASEPVPAELRKRIQQATGIDESTGAIRKNVARAMRGGSARKANLALALFGASTYVTVLVALVVWLDGAHWAVFAPAMLPFVAGAYARTCIAHRRALRALVVGCAAIAPGDTSHPSLCRSCRAPLPASSHVVVSCVYCHTANVIGVSLGQAAEAAAAEGELETTILEQRRAIRASWALAGFAVALGTTWLMLGSRFG